ncbi:unnamed protein product [Thlaspi arvense]|uniref:F-box/LRR-repeat protein 15-like leucin rich repeat domain-containing protein n=1 Tax=Thlaspi arvense TaxID=13288 RepID=A0AAU9RUQ1_THLAR|nr:unnamed protein product [Thlaspi arvense]
MDGRLKGGEERSICACVSKRWLMLLSSIRGEEICTKKETRSPETQDELNSSKADELVECNEKAGVLGFSSNKDEVNADSEEIESVGYLSSCLEGKKATDVRLAAIAIGTGHRGGLGKLSIHGNNSTRGVTKTGLRAIARCCPSLRVLSMWNVASVGDEGLYEIANECHMLEKLDLCHCPAISDKGLLAIAKNCPRLNSLTIESCSNIGNTGLQAVGSFCPNLKSVTIKNCPLVGDQGIASLLSSATYSLTKLKLQALNIGDVSLAVVGHYGKELTDLAFTGLENVSEKGFWVMGSGQGLQKLKSFAVSSCRGLTDVGLEAMAKGCPNLKQFCLRRCSVLSDIGLVSFAKAAVSLESLQLEDCYKITQRGFFNVLVTCCSKLKSIALANCLGFRDLAFRWPSVACCTSLRSLSIRNCPGFGNFSLSMLGRLCPNLLHVELNGLPGITDEGLLPLIENCKAGLSKVNLSSCVNLTDKVVSAIANLHGITLEQLNLVGCKYVTDASLAAIAKNCSLLSDLDVSKCTITDSGLMALACATQLHLQIFSLSGCSLISEKSVPSLLKLGRTLVGLNIQNCNAISSRMIDLLLERLWRCDILL